MESTNWNLHTIDGNYLGQFEAFSGYSAFHKCMSAMGKWTDEFDVASEEGSDGSLKIGYGRERFIVVPANAQFGARQSLRG
jgi:hypothetical protein